MKTETIVFPNGEDLRITETAEGAVIVETRDYGLKAAPLAARLEIGPCFNCDKNAAIVAFRAALCVIETASELEG